MCLCVHARVCMRVRAWAQASETEYVIDWLSYTESEFKRESAHLQILIKYYGDKQFAT